MTCDVCGRIVRPGTVRRLTMIASDAHDPTDLDPAWGAILDGEYDSKRCLLRAVTALMNRGSRERVHPARAKLRATRTVKRQPGVRRRPSKTVPA